MRTKLALRNLYISQTIIIVFLTFTYIVWFPHSFSKLGGFNETALMLIFVDLILGPLLVFIVYKEGKRFLGFDINTLLLIQLGAFLFGAYSLFLKHPAYAVFTVDRFSVANVSQLHPQLSLLDQLKTSFFSSPKLVTANFPSNADERKSLLFKVLFNGAPDIDKRPKYFEPFYASHTNIKAIFEKSIPLALLLQNQNSKSQLDSFYKKHGGKPSDYAYFPLSGNNKKDMIWVFNRRTAKPVGIIDSDPWLLIANKQAQTPNRLF